MATLGEILFDKQGRPLYSIEAERTALEAVDMMNQHSIGALIVTQGGRMEGIFTERDVLRRVLGERRNPQSVGVAEVMTRDVVCCDPETSVDEARAIMRERRVRHLPVIDADGNVAGLVSIGDLNAFLSNHQEVTIHYLNEYLHGRV